MNSIRVIKRTTENNTHSNIVDDSIIEVTSWRFSYLKLILFIFLSLISLGIVSIIAFFNVVFFVNLCFQKCQIEESTHFLVKDSDGNFNLCPSKRERFSDKNDVDLRNCIYIGNELENHKDDYHIVNLL